MSASWNPFPNFTPQIFMLNSLGDSQIRLGNYSAPSNTPATAPSSDPETYYNVKMVGGGVGKQNLCFSQVLKELGGARSGFFCGTSQPRF